MMEIPMQCPSPTLGLWPQSAVRPWFPPLRNGRCWSQPSDRAAPRQDFINGCSAAWLRGLLHLESAQADQRSAVEVRDQDVDATHSRALCEDQAARARDFRQNVDRGDARWISQAQTAGVIAREQDS